MKNLSKTLFMPVGVVVGSLLTAAVVIGQEAPITQLVSPNGQFTLNVADDGITLSGPNATLTLNNDGVDIVTQNGAVAISTQNGAITLASGQAFIVTSAQDSSVTSTG